MNKSKLNYLDWAATAIPQEDIIMQATQRAFNFFANPSAKHFAGKNAGDALEGSRKEIAELLGINSNELFFTSGGTEANHIPLLSMLNLKGQFSIAVSAIEHSSISAEVKVLEKNGVKVLRISSDKNGQITVDAVLNTIEEDTVFVSVMGVNNETGAIQPIKEISQALKEYSAEKKGRAIFFHSDMVQAFGKIPINIKELGVDSASFSAHKIGAPRGIGFLYLKKNIDSFIQGGGQENNIRPGTENLAGIFAMELALKNYILNQKEYLSNAEKLMSFLIEELKKIDGISFIPACRANKEAQKNFSPWILQFANKSLPGEVILRCLSEKGICISTGSACSSKKKTNPLIKAMQINSKLAKNINRVSIGPTTTMDDVREFVTAFKEVLAEF